MGSKSKKRSRRRAPVDSFELIRRNFERGDFKQALKDARVSYRKDATPKLRNLLEHVYVGRAEQLSRQGLCEDSRRIIQELLDLGVTEPSVQAGLPELLLSVGMLDHLPGGCVALTDDDRDRLQVKIADQAVLRPQNTPQGMSEIREDAQRIRVALEAVEQGDETAALAQLKDIPRQSQFADWKFFVRGLMAYYRRDKTDMLANWNRLDESRAAVTIAAPLKFMAGAASPQQDSGLTSKISRLEKQATSHSVLGTLTKLQEFAADHDWRQVLKTLRSVGGELRKLDANIYQRVVSWLCGVFIEDKRVEELDRLTRFAAPPPIDPHWNRARAVVRDNACDWGAQTYWKKYLSDLESLAALSPSERNLARGMVHLHLAQDYIDDVNRLRECDCGADHSSEIEDAEVEALEHFNQCLTLATAYRPGYAGLTEFHIAADRPHKAAEVYERWLERTPNDLEAICFLSQHCIACDEPLKAREFAERARQLKPLDKDISTLLWSTYVKAARQFACQGQFDRARDELAIADRLQPSGIADYAVLARKAVVEIKAGNPKTARPFIEQAQESLAEPTAFWLVMTIEATRFELPKEETWLYEKRWREALKRRCRSETAGVQCELMNAHLLTPQQQYGSRDEHVQILLKYVHRCSRVKWQVNDLRDVCAFLSTAEDFTTLEKMVKRGLRSFPQAAYLHWFAAQAEIGKGPYRCDRFGTLDHLREAIRLGSSSGDPRDKKVVDVAKQAQTLLDDCSPHHCDHEYDDFDDDDSDDDDNEALDALLDDMEGIPDNVIRGVVQGFCNQMGLDPDQMMRELERRRATRSRGTK